MVVQSVAEGHSSEVSGNIGPETRSALPISWTSTPGNWVTIHRTDCPYLRRGRGGQPVAPRSRIRLCKRCQPDGLPASFRPEARYPLAPIAEALQVPLDAVHTWLASHGIVAPEEAHRWLHEGVPEEWTDRLAIRIGSHPASIWENWGYDDDDL